jgi:hypothetical protein
MFSFLSFAFRDSLERQMMFLLHFKIIKSTFFSPHYYRPTSTFDEIDIFIFFSFLDGISAFWSTLQRKGNGSGILCDIVGEKNPL